MKELVRKIECTDFGFLITKNGYEIGCLLNARKDAADPKPPEHIPDARWIHVPCNVGCMYFSIDGEGNCYCNCL